MLQRLYSRRRHLSKCVRWETTPDSTFAAFEVEVW